MVKESLKILTAITCVVVAFQCANNDLETPPSINCDGLTTISFSATIEPLIESNCAISGCHDGSLGSSADWRNPATLRARSSEVRRRVLLPTSDPLHMPKNSTLDNDQVRQIVCWVEQGASITN